LFLSVRRERKMKVVFLDGPSLAEKIPQLMVSCTGLDMAMAYVKIGG